MKHVFVVLHYKTISDTDKCIKSILALNANCEIVIVDNASGNNTGQMLQKNYVAFRNIHFIILETNVGFAAANNIGYAYAKEKLKAEFIEVCNNDIIIESKDFLSLIENKYQKEKYYIAGPNLYNEKGKQQPLNIACLRKNAVVKKIILYRVALALCKIGLFNFLSKRTERILEKEKKKELNPNDTFLQGSFIIYSPSWVKCEDIAFYPGTFLYLEELLLKEYCVQKDYKYCYILNANVYHKGGSSTSEVCGTTKDKYVFRLRNTLKSLVVYLNMIKNKNI